MNRRHQMRHVIGIALATAIAGSAMAADLSVPAPPPVLVYNWTGIYGGVNGGGAWGQQDPFNILTNRFDHDSINFSGGTVGGTAGVQLQLAHVVLGFEADLDWAGIRGSSVRTPINFRRPGRLHGQCNDQSQLGSHSSDARWICAGQLAVLCNVRCGCAWRQDQLDHPQRIDLRFTWRYRRPSWRT